MSSIAHDTTVNGKANLPVVTAWKKRGIRVAWVLGLCIVARVVLARQSDGLITPERSVPWGLLAIGAAAISLRIYVLFIVVPYCAGRLSVDVGSFVMRWFGRDAESKATRRT